MAWRAALELLNRLGRWLDRWLRRQRRAQRQADRDRLEDDPPGWYRDHFNGVHDDADEQLGTDQADADDQRKSE